MDLGGPHRRFSIIRPKRDHGWKVVDLFANEAKPDGNYFKFNRYGMLLRQSWETYQSSASDEAFDELRAVYLKVHSNAPTNSNGKDVELPINLLHAFVERLKRFADAIDDGSTRDVVMNNESFLQMKSTVHALEIMARCPFNRRILCVCGALECVVNLLETLSAVLSVLAVSLTVQRIATNAGSSDEHCQGSVIAVSFRLQVVEQCVAFLCRFVEVGDASRGENLKVRAPMTTLDVIEAFYRVALTEGDQPPMHSNVVRAIVSTLKFLKACEKESLEFDQMFTIQTSLLTIAGFIIENVPDEIWWNAYGGFEVMLSYLGFPDECRNELEEVPRELGREPIQEQDCDDGARQFHGPNLSPLEKEPCECAAFEDKRCRKGGNLCELDIPTLDTIASARPTSEANPFACNYRCCCQVSFPEVPKVRLNRYFNIQIKVLAVLGASIQRHPRSMLLLSSLGLWDKIGEMGLFIGTYFSSFHTGNVVQASCTCGVGQREVPSPSNANVEGAELNSKVVYRKLPEEPQLGPHAILNDASSNNVQIGAFISELGAFSERAEAVLEYANLKEQECLASITEAKRTGGRRFSTRRRTSCTANFDPLVADLEQLRALAGRLRSILLHTFQHRAVSESLLLHIARHNLRHVGEIQISCLDTWIQMLWAAADDTVVLRKSSAATVTAIAGRPSQAVEPEMPMSVRRGSKLVSSALYGVLFGDYFYFLAPIHVATDPDMTRKLSGIRSMVREGVLYILKFMATRLHANYNLPELACLLGVLAGHSRETDVCTDLCTVLSYIIQHNRRASLPLIMELQGLEVLCQCLEAQNRALEELLMRPPVDLATLSASVSAQNSVLTVLDELLTTDEAKALAIEDPRVPLAGLLVKCLPQQALRKFCVRHLRALLTLHNPRPWNSPNNLEPLVAHLFGMLVKCRRGEIGGYPLLWEIMDTVQAVLSILLQRESSALLHGNGTGPHQNLKATQRLFHKHGDCFNGLMEMLRSPPQSPADWAEVCTEEMPSRLCCQVLKTLTLLLKRNTKMKAEFERLVGPHKLAQGIRACVPGLGCPEVYDSLFQMLVEDESTEETGIHAEATRTIQNPFVLLAILELLLCTDFDTLLGCGVLKRMADVIQASVLNLATAGQAPLMEPLLRMLVGCTLPEVRQQVERCVQLVGRNHIRVAQFKSLVTSLKDAPPSAKPELLPSVIRILHNMARPTVADEPEIPHQVHPCGFFAMDGTFSGLRLPAIRGWPTTRGYTFATWLRLERLEPFFVRRKGLPPENVPFTPGGSGAPVRYTPCLYSFMNPRGRGFETVFNEKSLVFRVHTSKGVSEATLPHPFQPLRWYHIVVTHSCPIDMRLMKGECKLFVDGTLYSKTTLSYPRTPSNGLDLNFIGTDQRGWRKQTSSTSICGQMTAVYLLDDALTTQHAQALYALGPDHMSAFSPMDCPMGCKPETAVLFDGVFCGRITMAFSPMAQDGRRLWNLARSQTSSREATTAAAGCVAAMLKSTVVCSNLHNNLHMVDVLDCIGGARMLLPLFTMLLDPNNSLDARRFATQAPPAQEMVSPACIPQMLDHLLALLASVLGQQRARRVEFVECGGFQIVGMLISRLGQFLTPSCVEHLYTLLVQDMTDPSEFFACLRFLFLEGDLWVRAAADVQQKVPELLLTACSSSSHTVPAVRQPKALEAIFNNLRWYYRCSAGEEGSAAAPALNNALICEIRAKYLQVVRMVLTNGAPMSVAETALILQNVLHSPEPHQAGDLLLLLLQLQCEPRTGVMEHLCALGALEALTSLLTCDNIIARCACIAIIGKLALAVPGQTGIDVRAPWGFCCLVQNLSMYPFCLTTYGALRGVLLGAVTPQTPLPAAFCPLPRGQRVAFAVPCALPAMLALTRRRASPEVARIVLQDLCQCATTAEVLPTLPGWQEMVLKVLSREDGDAPGLAELVTELLGTALFHGLLSGSSGCNQLQDTVVLLQGEHLPNSAALWNRISRRLLDGYLHRMEAGALSPHVTLSPGALISNLTFVLMLVEEQVCCHRIVSKALQTCTASLGLPPTPGRALLHAHDAPPAPQTPVRVVLPEPFPPDSPGDGPHRDTSHASTSSDTDDEEAMQWSIGDFTLFGSAQVRDTGAPEAPGEGRGSFAAAPAGIPSPLCEPILVPVLSLTQSDADGSEGLSETPPVTTATAVSDGLRSPRAPHATTDVTNLPYDEARELQYSAEGHWLHMGLIERTARLMLGLALHAGADGLSPPGPGGVTQGLVLPRSKLARLALRVARLGLMHIGPHHSTAACSRDPSAQPPATVSGGPSPDATRAVLDIYLTLLKDTVVQDKTRERSCTERVPALSSAVGEARMRTLFVIHVLVTAVSVSDEYWQHFPDYCQKIFEVLEWVCHTRREFLIPAWKPWMSARSIVTAMFDQALDSYSFVTFRTLLDSSDWRQVWQASVVPATEAWQRPESDAWKDVFYRCQLAMGALQVALQNNRTEQRRYEARWKAVVDRSGAADHRRLLVMPPMSVTAHTRESSKHVELAMHRVLRIITSDRSLWAPRVVSTGKVALDMREQQGRVRIKTLSDPSLPEHRSLEHCKADDGSEKTLERTKSILRRSSRRLSVLEQLEGFAEAKEDPESPERVSQEDGSQEERRLMVVENLILITPMQTYSGRLEITSKTVCCVLDEVNKCRPQDSANAATQVLMKRMHPGNSTWPLDTIVEVWPRRYRLQRCALELMFRDGHSAMFSLISRAVCDEALKVLQKHARNLRAKHSPHPEMDLKSSGLTEKWQRREISNFEYLMHLNTYAGRTYNDLSQYPVFPWVLRDYTSDTLDLGDERVYRDLRQPIGVLGPAERQTHVVDRYETLRQADMEPFHFGSHYSSLGVVLYYLIRLEPFTSLAVLLQGGKFDHADRLFDGLEHCWTGCLEGTCNVKELIPEFYYLPEVFLNNNRVRFGERQDGRRLDDVVLPPWARGDPVEFVRRMREALESEYVSQHLNEWVDLIFGYKQQGPAAEAAVNVFHPLTYEGNVDFDELQDEVERESVISQIDNFGQTPIQLFSRKHPPRDKGGDKLRFNPFLHQPTLLRPCMPCTMVARGTAIVTLQVVAGCDRLVTVTATGMVLMHKLSMSPACTIASVRAAGKLQAPLPDHPPPQSTLLPEQDKPQRPQQQPLPYLPTQPPTLLPRSERDSYHSEALSKCSLSFSFTDDTLPSERCVSPSTASRMSSAWLSTDGSLPPSRGPSSFPSSARPSTDSALPLSRGASSALPPAGPDQPLPWSRGASRMDSLSLGTDGTRLCTDWSSPPSGSSEFRFPTLSERYLLESEALTSPVGSDDGSAFEATPSTLDNPRTPASPPLVGAANSARHLKTSPAHPWPFVFAAADIEDSAGGAMPIRATPYTFATAFIEKELYVFVAGVWDDSCQIRHVTGSQVTVIQSLREHKELVSCVAVSADGSVLVTGSCDTTSIIWALRGSRTGLVAHYCHTLYGHDAAVTCLAVCPGLDLVASGSKDGSVLLHSISNGAYERCLWHPDRHPVDLVAVAAASGTLVFCSNRDQRIYSCSVNGLPLAVVSAGSRLSTILVSPDSQFLVTGGAPGAADDHPLVVRRMADLEVVTRYAGPHCGVCSLAMHPDGQLLILGLEDGSVMFFSVLLS